MRGLHPDFALRARALERPGTRRHDGFGVSNSRNLSGQAGQHGFPHELLMTRLAFLIAEQFKNLSGLNVRQPSHLEPPFRARGYQHFEDDSTTVALTTFSDTHSSLVAFGPGVTVVPDGWRGVVSHAFVTGRNTSNGTTEDAAEGIRWRLVKNGVPIAGYHDLPAAGDINRWDVGLGAGQTEPGNSPYLVPRLVAPVLLEEGDSIRVQYRETAGGITMRCKTWAYGWLYPVRVHEHSIRGTLVD